MAILELRILPPVAVGRLGSSTTPLEAFDLVVSKESPLDYRQIVPRETFRINAKTGAIDESYIPTSIRFKEEDGTIRPVAPFLEVFAITDDDPSKLVPLTIDLLEDNGLKLKDLHWSVDVGNIKIFRRTNNPDDKIAACIPEIKDHKRHELLATCTNFIDGKTLPLGSVQFIKPTKKQSPQIRFRYTPAAGNVYGSALERHTSLTQVEPDPIINSEDLILYDKNKGTWRGYTESSGPTLTNPAQIFAGYDTAEGHVSWGYLDDECDGFVTVTLNLGKGQPLTAHAHIGAGPPAFAPDTLPIRVVSDELEQIFDGPEVQGEVPIDEAEEIVRRALETIRLMNTAVMNGNSIDGRENVASTMVRQDTNDFERLYEPIMATSLVDSLALRALHERVFSGLSSGAAPWFADVLRRPNEIGDLSNEMRRKMPALMRNADGRALCLTHRHINAVIRAAASAMFQATAADPVPEPAAAASNEPALEPGNRTAQIHFRGGGNPYSVLPRTAISNCFPGLEYDFRNLWRRTFEGIVLVENNNYVVDADPGFEHLITRRLVSIDDGTRKSPTMVETTGPVFPGGDSQTLVTTYNPNGVSFMEWSNSLAHILQMQGQEVTCYFTAETCADTEVLADKVETIEVRLKVRQFFDGNTAAFAPGLLEPGELTQGLCAPWQNDYRECACYYWAASRPDYVNVEPGEDGISHGDAWLAKKRTGTYIPDNRTDTRLVSYDDLFKDWQKELSFIIRGRDAHVSPEVTSQGEAS